MAVEIVKETPPNFSSRHGPLRLKQTAMLAAVLAVVQACLTINGRGIEGFVLWIFIFFLGYWFLFSFLIWLWGVLRKRS
jgi:hypothetical protein